MYINKVSAPRLIPVSLYLCTNIPFVSYYCVYTTYSWLLRGSWSLETRTFYGFLLPNVGM